MLADHTPGAFIAVEDEDRAIAFYRDILGLEYRGFDGFAHRFRAGPINLRIVKPPQGRAPADYTVFGWETCRHRRRRRRPDRQGGQRSCALSLLQGHQQDEAGVWTAPGGDKVAWFLDPDGNNLSLAQHV